MIKIYNYINKNWTHIEIKMNNNKINQIKR